MVSAPGFCTPILLIIGNDDLMVVGEYSGSSNNYNRSNNERRDQEKDYKDNKEVWRPQKEG